MNTFFFLSQIHLIFNGRIRGFIASMIAFDGAKLVKLCIMCKYSTKFSTVMMEKTVIYV